VGQDIPYERTCPNLPVHPSFIERGQKLAKDGRRNEAVAIFEKVLELDPDLDLNPQAEAKKWAAQGLLEKGENLARKGNLDEAVAQFQKAKELDSDLDLDPQTEAKKWAAQGLLAKGQELTRQGEIREALEAYAKAKRLNPGLKIPAWSWNALCWSGSLRGHAADVINACEQAVTLKPEYGDYRNSRGLARALTGDTERAIEDFHTYIDWTSDKEKKSQRQRWIEALRKGQNPFTDEVLERLRNE